MSKLWAISMSVRPISALGEKATGRRDDGWYNLEREKAKILSVHWMILYTRVVHCMIDRRTCLVGSSEGNIASKAATGI